MVARHGGEVPSTHAELIALPGVGAYTAAAVACFAFEQPEVVVDTNVRRVLARAVTGDAFPQLTLTRAESDLARECLPPDRTAANTWNVAVMELGALVCVARGPRCDQCPIADLCAWNRAGRPAYDGPARKGQSWHGTDRQVRGELLQRLRSAPGPVALAALEDAGPDAAQVLRCLDSLVADGLVDPLSRQRFRLPRLTSPHPAPRPRPLHRRALAFTVERTIRATRIVLSTVKAGRVGSSCWGRWAAEAGGAGQTLPSTGRREWRSRPAAGSRAAPGSGRHTAAPRHARMPGRSARWPCPRARASGDRRPGTTPPGIGGDVAGLAAGATRDDSGQTRLGLPG